MSDEWYGQQVEAKSKPLEDEGRGKPYIIRQFDFSFDPAMLQKVKEKKIAFPTKQQLFNQSWGAIRPIIWGDGLVANEDIEPRVLIGKKGYRIVLLCEPKFGAMVVDKPQLLQNVLKKKK